VTTVEWLAFFVLLVSALAAGGAVTLSNAAVTRAIRRLTRTYRRQKSLELEQLQEEVVGRRMQEVRRDIEAGPEGWRKVLNQVLADAPDTGHRIGPAGLLNLSVEPVPRFAVAGKDGWEYLFTTSPEALRRKRGLPQRMILFVGTLEPRKNAETLIRAYARLRRASAIPHRLVLAGGRGWRYEGLFALVEELGLQDDVLFPGFVPYDELPLWYNAADLFVFPSLYEGFGLPPLEAMACGVPVVVSSVSSLPEVVGDAGLLVDPLDVEGLAEAMARVLNDGALRAEMRGRGLARAERFSWLETARGTVRVYERVLKTSPR